MAHGHQCYACNHLGSRHLLQRGGDLRQGPYRCMDCGCQVTQDTPMRPLSRREYEAEKVAGMPTYEDAP